MDLHKLLPQLMPDAIAWAKTQAEHIATYGVALTEPQLGVARRVGVQRPELIRIKLVDQIPTPQQPLLRQAALATGLLGPGMIGLTLGYGIYLVQGHDDVPIISHECRHVYQYETFGSIEAFLPVYLQQIVEYGYDSAPFEIDARAHEIQSV